MKYTKKYNKIQADEGKGFLSINDFGSYTEDQKYVLPELFTEAYLAKNLTKEDALKLYEELTQEELEAREDELKAKLDAQIAETNQEEMISEAEIIEEVE